jgi:hypothetical protein
MASVSKSNQSTKQYAMFCSFCFHSKRPEAEFSSHWVKNKKDGAVCCPLLLENVCGYCKGKGHTPKHCPRLASREQRREAHTQRFRRQPHVSPIRGLAQVQQQIRQKEEVTSQQKRARLACSDNHYAALMGAPTHPVKRAKTQRAALRGPKASEPRPLQGSWAPPSAPARNLNADEVDQLKALLSKMGICDEVFASEMPAEEIAKALHAKQHFVGEQSLEETADGEAFFDNNHDAEDAVMALACDEQLAPFAAEAAAAGSSPLPLPAIQLPANCVIPDSCNLDADFGEAGNDGWGSD